MAASPPRLLDRSGYRLEIEDEFAGPTLDRRLWLPHYLPQWSSRDASAARYEIRDGALRLRIDADQPPWCPEFNGGVRVSSLQTGVFAGPLGSTIGQHRFSDGLVVREEQVPVSLYTPWFGLFEARVMAIADPHAMVALWMIGFEDEPDRSAEICIFEIFGRDVTPAGARVGMGVHPFGDPALSDEFSREFIPIDVRDFHVYGAEWAPDDVSFYVDDRLVRTVPQSPAYPMQFMLNIYDFADGRTPPSPPSAYPKTFVVDWFRGWRRSPG